MTDHDISNEIDSYVEFKIRNLGNSEEFYVDITIKPVGTNFQNNDSIAAFTYSLTPELDKRNNYAVLDL